MLGCRRSSEQGAPPTRGGKTRGSRTRVHSGASLDLQGEGSHGGASNNVISHYKMGHRVGRENTHNTFGSSLMPKRKRFNSTIQRAKKLVLTQVK